MLLVHPFVKQHKTKLNCPTLYSKKACVFFKESNHNTESKISR